MPSAHVCLENRLKADDVAGLFRKVGEESGIVLLPPQISTDLLLEEYESLLSPIGPALPTLSFSIFLLRPCVADPVSRRKFLNPLTQRHETMFHRESRDLARPSTYYYYKVVSRKSIVKPLWLLLQKQSAIGLSVRWRSYSQNFPIHLPTQLQQTK